MARVVDQSVSTFVKGPELPTTFAMSEHSGDTGRFRAAHRTVQQHHALLERIPLAGCPIGVVALVALCICQGQLHDEGCRARQCKVGWRDTRRSEGGEMKMLGPRPPSVKWAVAQPLKQVVPRGGRWRGARNVADSKSAPVPSVPPDVAREGARNRVSQLQTAIAAFGNYKDQRSPCCGEAMKKAQRAAQEPPIQPGQRVGGVHCPSGEATVSPRPAEVESVVRFGGRAKQIAAVALSG